MPFQLAIVLLLPAGCNSLMYHKSMKHVAVIGLGIMGHGIADNFLKQGYEVSVWNRTAAKAVGLVRQGAKLASSVKDAAMDADLVFEVTANDQSSASVWADILAVAKPEQYLITCATLSTDCTDDLAKQCADKGLTFFDMPMTGGRVGAESGQLTLLAGGDKDKLETINQDLQAIAKDVKYFGKAGSGMRYKLILNSLQAIHLAGFGEAMRMAAAVGLDQDLVGRALAERPGGVLTAIAREAYLQAPDPITFSVEWIAKDLGYASDMAGAVNHPLLDDVKKQFDAAIDQGYGQDDWTKVNKL
jgi:3-hydroxyisobutyrate dehydrogenase-like beta-hydroxyacid dehydrogenase